MSDLLAPLADAVDWTASAVAGASRQDPCGVTPCSEWDLAALRDHVVEGAVMFAGAMGAQVDDLPAGPPEERYRAAADRLLAALAAPGALDQQAELPVGIVPGAVLAGIFLTEATGHGWDLARSSGQPHALPQAAAEAALGFAHQIVTPEIRQGGHYGPEVAVDAGAPVTDRLVAFLGRTP